MDQDMLRLPKPQASLVFLPSPYEPGGLKDSSNVSDLQIPTIDTISTASNVMLTIRQQRDLKKSRKYQAVQERKNEYAIVESQAENKQMILQDRSSTSSQTFPTIPLSKTLEAASITNVKAFSLYSRTQLKEISQKLWLPTGTDYADLELNSSSGSSSNIKSNSLFSIRALKNPNEKSVQTSYPSFTFFPVGSTAKDDTLKKKKPRKVYPKKVQVQTMIPCQFPMRKKIEGKKYAVACNMASENGVCSKHCNKTEPTDYEKFWPYTCQYKLIGVRRGFSCGKACLEGQEYCKAHLKSIVPADSMVRAFKVRIYPSVQDKITLHKWFGDCRTIYNTLKADNCQDNFEDARSEYVNKYEYTKTTPKEIRASAIKDYVTGRDNARKKYGQRLEWYEENIRFRKKPSEPTMKFRIKKDQQCINIPKLAVNFKDGKLNIYPTYLQDPIQMDKRTRPNKDGKIKDKKWQAYMNGQITHDIKILRTRTDKYYYCIPYDALPETPDSKGVTALDKGGRKFLVCYSPTEVLFIAEHKHDFFRKYKKLISDLKHDPAKTKQRLLLEEKLTNKVNDLHYKTIKHLTSTYSTIILPKFSSKKCIEGPNLRPLAKFMLQRYKHFQFDQRLKSKAEITGSKLILGSEWDTSKTCTGCFTLDKARKEEIHVCSGCDFHIDRDVGASRNILIKHIKSLTV